MFGGGLAAAGMPLAWRQQTNLWGFSSVPLTALMAEPEATVVYIAPLPFPSMAALDDNQLWQRLPAVRGGVWWGCHRSGWATACRVSSPSPDCWRRTGPLARIHPGRC